MPVNPHYTCSSLLENKSLVLAGLFLSSGKQREFPKQYYLKISSLNIRSSSQGCHLFWGYKQHSTCIYLDQSKELPKDLVYWHYLDGSDSPVSLGACSRQTTWETTRCGNIYCKVILMPHKNSPYYLYLEMLTWQRLRGQSVQLYTSIPINSQCVQL